MNRSDYASKMLLLEREDIKKTTIRKQGLSYTEKPTSCPYDFFEIYSTKTTRPLFSSRCSRPAATLSSVVLNNLSWLSTSYSSLFL